MPRGHPRRFARLHFRIVVVGLLERLGPRVDDPSVVLVLGLGLEGHRPVAEQHAALVAEYLQPRLACRCALLKVQHRFAVKPSG